MTFPADEQRAQELARDVIALWDARDPTWQDRQGLDDLAEFLLPLVQDSARWQMANSLRQVSAEHIDRARAASNSAEGETKT